MLASYRHLFFACVCQGRVLSGPQASGFKRKRSPVALDVLLRGQPHELPASVHPSAAVDLLLYHFRKRARNVALKPRLDGFFVWKEKSIAQSQPFQVEIHPYLDSGEAGEVWDDLEYKD